MITTKDFGLASLLISRNITMQDYTTDNMNQMWFTFEDSDLAKSIERDYFTATAITNVQDFMGAQKMLKSLIHESKRKLYAYKIGNVGNISR